MNGKILAEGKDEMKKRGLKSPNLADALNLTFYQDYDTFKESYLPTTEVESKYRKKKKRFEVGWKGR